MIWGYGRVSTSDQDNSSQIEKLKAAGCTNIKTEKVSGGSREGRHELEVILSSIRKDDVLVIVKLDRLGRNTRDILNLAFELNEKGASLQILEPPVDTGGPMGMVVLTVLGMVAEMELSFIRDRQRTGIEAAKARGVYTGRERKITPEDARKLVAQGYTKAQIAEMCAVTRGTVYRALRAT